MEFILGLIIGAACMFFLKGFLEKNNDNSESIKRECNSLNEQNEKLRKRNKEAERQIEDLMSENTKLKKNNKSSDDEKDDLEDDLDASKLKIKRLIAQNDELLRKIEEYKVACVNYEEQIKNLKA